MSLSVVEMFLLKTMTTAIRVSLESTPAPVSVILRLEIISSYKFVRVMKGLPLLLRPTSESQACAFSFTFPYTLAEKYKKVLK